MNSLQSTNTVLMIRPCNFGFNSLTAIDNTYQNEHKNGLTDLEIAMRAKLEFDELVSVLKKNGVCVVEFDDLGLDSTPDSLFPNNWISTHANGIVYLYPMFSPNRRLERRKDIVDYLNKNFNVHQVFDDAKIHEDNNIFLEGTGSVVLDRENKIAYASISKRTDEGLFIRWCEQMNFRAIYFNAEDSQKPIYHTNVLMSICQHFVIICMDAIVDDRKKEELRTAFSDTNKQIIEITIKQMNSFLGNVLELRSQENESLLVMSSLAFCQLTDSQKKIINTNTKIIHAPLDTIEYFGGGSARCMIAELFLNPKINKDLIE